MEVSDINFVDSLKNNALVELPGTKITTANKWKDISVSKNGSTLTFNDDGSAVFTEKTGSTSTSGFSTAALSPVITYDLEKLDPLDAMKKLGPFLDEYLKVGRLYDSDTTILSGSLYSGVVSKLRSSGSSIEAESAYRNSLDKLKIGLDTGLITYTPISIDATTSETPHTSSGAC